MAFEFTQVNNDTVRQYPLFTDEIFGNPASQDRPQLQQSANLCAVLFDAANPFLITPDDRRPAVGSIERLRDAPRSKQHSRDLPKELTTELQSLTAEFAEGGKFISDEQLKGVLDGTIAEKDLLINRLRSALKKAVGDGKDIGPAIDAMNKKLAELKSPFEIKADEYKRDGTEGFNIKLVDKKSGKDADKFLAITWDESQLERLSSHFSTGRFLSKEELEKTIDGTMLVKDTKLGELMTTIQDAVARGIDPMKVVDGMNNHLAKSKSKFKIEAEKDGDSIRLRLVDRDSGKQSDKVRVPFKPLEK